jgi:uncharacterized membrane protein (UPF0127 family)
LGDCTPEQAEFRGPAGLQRFHIELADDPDEQAKGLMFREKLAMSSGMLFVFEPPKHATFWMRNTLVPLDMIFINAFGVVTKVHENAVPHDETPIDGGDDVAFVLEINAGLAKRMGLGPGSEMRHPMIEQSGAVWACNAP